MMNPETPPTPRTQNAIQGKKASDQRLSGHCCRVYKAPSNNAKSRVYMPISANKTCTNPLIISDHSLISR